MPEPIVVSLFDFTGNMVRPWADAWIQSIPQENIGTAILFGSVLMSGNGFRRMGQSVSCSHFGQITVGFSRVRPRMDKKRVS